jgi:hypothetical protein
VTSLVSWINNHGKERAIFDEEQARISLSNRGYSLVLAYLMANLTRWTSHCVSFIRLLSIQDALKSAVYAKRALIVKAEVGAAKSTEAVRLTADAETHCSLIIDPTFWNGLEQVVGDIEPICYSTNINQKDSTWPDQVLLVLVGMYLHFCEHPEDQVCTGMMKRLEKQ